jgi:hypothetical protein
MLVVMYLRLLKQRFAARCYQARVQEQLASGTQAHRASQQRARTTHRRSPSARIESVIVTNGDVVTTTAVSGPGDVTLLHIRLLP